MPNPSIICWFVALLQQVGVFLTAIIKGFTLPAWVPPLALTLFFAAAWLWAIGH